MGQKTSPKAFRLITNQKHLSNFYSPKTSYSSIIEEDFKIRNKIKEIFDEYLILSSVEINRSQKINSQYDFVSIKVKLLHPRKKQADSFMQTFFSNFDEDDDIKDMLFSTYKFKYKRKSILKSRIFSYALFILKRDIKKFIYTLKLKSKNSYSISIKIVTNAFEDATFITKYITGEINKRIKIRRIIKIIVERIFSCGKYNKILGLKIRLSGRLNGAEMARREWKREGKMPLHTLKAVIDYSYEFVNTIHGTIGVKVWLFKGLNKIYLND